MSNDKLWEQTKELWNNHRKDILNNLSFMVEKIKNNKASQEEIGHIINYVWDLAEIEAKTRWVKQNIKDELKSFIKISLNNKFDRHLLEYNIGKYDIDWQKWMDKAEEQNYITSIEELVNQVVIFWWIDKFSSVHRESALDTWVDKYLSKVLNFQKHVFWDKGSKHFVEEKIQQYAMMSEQDLNTIKNKKFDITSKESLGDLSMLFFKEFWDWTEDVLRFLLNIPSWILLIPRYTKYRLDLNSNDLQKSTEAEIKIKELILENPSLILLEILWEKGIDMLKQLWKMLSSWTQWDIATMMVTIMWLFAWWATVTRLWLNLSRKSMVKSARLAWKEARILWNTSSKVTRNSIRDISNSVKPVESTLYGIDDIVAWAWLWHLIKFWRQLSKTEELNRTTFFNDWFENTINQWDVWTCYFLSSLEMTKSIKIGKLNLLNMIEKIEQNWVISYNVKFPWANSIVNISEKELLLINSKWYNLKKWTLWDEIISVAHMKYMYENSDLFKEKNITFKNYINNHNRQRYADMVFESWQEADAIKLLWWEKNIIVDYFYLTSDWIGFNRWEMFLPPKWLAKTSHKINYQDLSKFIEDWAMVWVWTKRKWHPWVDQNREFGLIEKDFYWNDIQILWPHAYWVKNLDIKNGFIELSEPFNSWKIIRFKIDQFNTIFNSLTLVRQRK